MSALSPHLVDARRLAAEFAKSDPRTPMVAFSLLSLYFDNGPFEFDAAALVEKLEAQKYKARLNAQELASLQPDLEQFFEPTPEGWRPRPGVLEARAG